MDIKISTGDTGCYSSFTPDCTTHIPRVGDSIRENYKRFTVTHVEFDYDRDTIYITVREG